jgi:Zn-dependent protease with chaperone function
MATTAPSLICPQGHGAGVSGSRFCTFCGATLVAPTSSGQTSSAPAQPVPANPGGAQRVAGGGWQPVSTGPAQTAPASAAPALAAPAAQWQPPAAASTQAPAAPQWHSNPTAAPMAVAQQLPPGAIPAGAIPAAAIAANQQLVCKVCGGTGTGLNDDTIVCSECSWLRPLLPGYKLNRSVFLWAQDGQAMTHLQSISALHSAAKSISEKVGRPWIESTFNGIRLGPRQFPDIWIRAVLAARILGLPKMPDVYISGDSQWNTYTYGTDTSAFVVLGTAILNNFQNDDLLFVLAREMGHCRAGHALWKTVARFLVGDDSVRKGLLSGGVLNAISLSPTKWIQDAADLPLMAWSRQADITADRAALLALGDEALARRVLLAWSIRSARLLKQVNIEEWMKQEDASGDQMTRFSEMTTTSSMYTTRRLRLLGQAAREKELMRWSQTIQPIRKRLTPPPQPPISGLTAAAPGVRRPLTTPRPAAASGSGAGAAPGATIRPATGVGAAGPIAGQASAPADSVRVICNKCQGPMRIPLAVLRGKTSLNVRCPKCQNIFTIRPRSASQAAASPGAPPQLPASGATQAKPQAPPVSPSAPAKPAGTPQPGAAQSKPSVAKPSSPKPPDAKPSGAVAPASKPAAAPPVNLKTKSPDRPSVTAAAHKHAK